MTNDAWLEAVFASSRRGMYTAENQGSSLPKGGVLGPVRPESGIPRRFLDFFLVLSVRRRGTRPPRSGQNWLRAHN